MRKLYTIVASACLMFASLAANAQTMTNENPVLDQMGYRLEKDVNFYEGTVNGKSFVAEDYSGGNCFKYGEAEDFKINSQAVSKIMNEGLEFMSQQLAGNGISLEPNTYGLTSTSNERWIVVKNLREGQILAFDISDADTTKFVPNSTACNSGTGWADSFAEPLQVLPISDGIHAIQELAEEGSADTYRYFKVNTAGAMYAKFNGKSGRNNIYRMQIWSDKNDAEAVTAPMLKLTGVNGGRREVEFKAGESTFGNECTSWYGIVDEEGQALYLIDTDEIDHYDTVYEISEEGDTLSTTQVPVYKKIIDPEMFADGTYGDNMYDPEAGSITIDASNDADGDGYVTVAAATVSSTGAFSEIITMNVSVGEIALNTPTATLVGFDGLQRIYQIGWNNNTICGESYSIVVEGDDGALYNECEPNAGIGESFAVSSSIKVTVSVNGYTSGVLEQDVDNAGVEVKRKNAAVDEEGNPRHDWDFVNITPLQKAIVQGTVVENCYIKTEEGDSVVYSLEEYEAGVSKDGSVDLSGATPNYAASCWWYDSSRNRATLNVNSDTIVDTSLLHDKNSNGYGYVVDEARIYEGLAVSCPANANNNSCIFQYIGKSDWADGGYNGDGITELGAYFMAAPTFTFSREQAAAGEYVVFYTGQGGSNYTSTRSMSIYEVPAGELLSVTLAKNGVHVFYIDIYTYDSLPTDEVENPDDAYAEVVNINSVSKAVQPIVAYYSANGAKISAPQKGVNIAKYADGSSMKFIVK